MKNLLISLSLLLVLTGFGAFVFLNTAGAQNNIITDLLKLPAPPPPNPFVKNPYKERDEGFYSKKTPPGDDAPIDDLLDYWRNQSANYQELGFNIKPTAKVLERLMDEIEKDHANLSGLLNILPTNGDTAGFVKRIYDSIGPDERDAGNDYDGGSEAIKEWLKYHSPYFSDELVEGSQGVGDANEYVTNQDELLALTRVDFSKAQAILNRLYNDSTQPVSQTLAKWALYRHALDTDSFGDIERYRDELKAVVENRSATAGQRDLAFDALVKEKDWSGRDDWYYGLLEDETLADLRVNGRSYTGLTTIIYYSPPEKYAERMIELLKSSNPAIRNAAIRNLGLVINKDNPEVIEALLPWLEDPKWAKETGGERGRLIDALQAVAIPASVPGLIETLDEKMIVQINTQAGNSNQVVTRLPQTAYETPNTLVNYPFRSRSISALAMQRDTRAVPALRRVLPEVEEYDRTSVVRAIYQSHGYSVPEQVEALEMAARVKAIEGSDGSPAVNTNTSRIAIDGFGGLPNVFYRLPVTGVTNESSVLPPSDYYANSNTAAAYVPRPFSGVEAKAILGEILVETSEADEPLVTAVLDRIAVLDRREPRIATELRRILLSWSGPAVNAMMLHDLINGKATVDSIVKLLSLRAQIVEKQPAAVNEARGGPPLAAGIASCMFNNNGDYDAILSSDNADLKIAMLACARLVRADLPVSKVAEYMGGANKTLALAAERYLESNDSPEARGVVLSYHPNESRILGATTYFAPGEDTLTSSDYLSDLFRSLPGDSISYPYYLGTEFGSDIRNTEKRLQKEVRENAEIVGIYAYDDNFIRIFKDRAVFSWEDDEARYFERTLKTEEFDSFKSFLAANRVDELPPFLSEPGEESDDEPAELLMLSKHGGRRVFMMGSEIPKFFEQLDSAFEEFRKPPAKLHYWLEKDLPGLEILFADENLSAEAVWKNGDDVRVLINDQKLREQIDKELEKQQEAERESPDYDYEKAYERQQKREAERQYEHLSWRKYAREDLSGLAAQPAGIELIPPRDNYAIVPSTEGWKARAGGVEIRAGYEGLIKISRGQMTRVRRGSYAGPLISPDGRWAIATRYGEGNVRLVRLNLLTNKEFASDVPMVPLVFVPAINQVLVRIGGNPDENGGTTGGEFFFLDPATGAVQTAKGEVRPLAQQSYRRLQATAVPDEFWAAIPDEAKKETTVGIYNARTFSFKPLQKIPKISFSSMDMWVDAKESRIYLVYLGHLLALPLKKA